MGAKTGCYPAALMLRAGTRERAGGARSSLLIATIVAGMVTATLLALEAYRAASYHRRAAQSVLRDYATLAANEMVRRSATDLGYYGYAQLWRQLVGTMQMERRRTPPPPA